MGPSTTATDKNISDTWRTDSKAARDLSLYMGQALDGSPLHKYLVTWTWRSRILRARSCGLVFISIPIKMNVRAGAGARAVCPQRGINCRDKLHPKLP